MNKNKSKNYLFTYTERHIKYIYVSFYNYILLHSHGLAI